jgi:hypothetical protein
MRSGLYAVGFGEGLVLLSLSSVLYAFDLTVPALLVPLVSMTLIGVAVFRHRPRGRYAASVILCGVADERASDLDAQLDAMGRSSATHPRSGWAEAVIVARPIAVGTSHRWLECPVWTSG